MIIELHFNTTTNVALCDLEVNIAGLMDLLCRPSNFIIRIFLACPYHANQAEVFDLDVDKLRMNLFFVLCDMVKQWPASLESKMSAKLMNVCVSGKGSLESVTCSTSEGTKQLTKENRFDQYTKENLRLSGHGRAASFEDLALSLCRAAPGSNWDQMTCVIHQLRDMGWRVWRAKRPRPSMKGWFLVPWHS